MSYRHICKKSNRKDTAWFLLPLQSSKIQRPVCESSNNQGFFGGGGVASQEHALQREIMKSWSSWINTQKGKKCIKSNGLKKRGRDDFLNNRKNEEFADIWHAPECFHIPFSKCRTQRTSIRIFCDYLTLCIMELGLQLLFPGQTPAFQDASKRCAPDSFLPSWKLLQKTFHFSQSH